jgi:putative transposase
MRTLHALVRKLNMSLRKIIKMRGSFPNDAAAMKLLYLALRNASKKWTIPAQNGQNWSGALTHLRHFAIQSGHKLLIPLRAMAPNAKS